MSLFQFSNVIVLLYQPTRILFHGGLLHPRGEVHGLMLAILLKQVWQLTYSAGFHYYREVKRLSC